jgi:hypothetical protein
MMTKIWASILVLFALLRFPVGSGADVEVAPDLVGSWTGVGSDLWVLRL